MLGSNIEPPQPTKVKKLGLTGSASSEFAKRFMTKPTRQPKVIDFNAGNVQVDKKRRGINGFFPPMKLRNSAKEVKSNSNGENKANDEHNDLGLCIDSSVTKQNVDKHEEKTTESLKLPEINTKEPTETQVELTQNNLRKQFPKHISIPIVEETETIESNSTRALDSSIQFKLPPVILSAVSDGDQKKLGTKERCTACNNRDQTTHFPNIWLIHEDFDTSDLQYEDFTNAILGHFPTSNFRLRRELTIYWDRHPGSKRFFELHVPAIETENYPGAPLEKSNTDSSLMLRQNLGRYKVDAMKYMTREVYTNLKLSKSITRAKEDRLQLVPTSYSEVRPRSNTSRAVSRSSRRSVGARKTPESVRTVPPNPTENYLPYADTFDCDDLSYLPPPKRILPRRDAPWVFRYKVKKNMNTLSKILASKPQQAIENV